ncbi:hypothetical protein DPMN_023621 [Dreissena polymorpha]|uniref:Uncharacterized protein n=1 Tax=Dreissena polymorpha TaxID=45954 RepID=A0A9D4LN98_DREPO|nr:hypothetical protein DPMN_023621 [Dreissena polymorpha]
MASMELWESFRDMLVETCIEAARKVAGIPLPICLAIFVGILTILLLRMLHQAYLSGPDITTFTNAENTRHGIRCDQDVHQDVIDAAEWIQEEPHAKINAALTYTKQNVKIEPAEVVNAIRHEIESSQIDVTERVDAAVIDSTREVKYALNTGFDSLKLNIESSQMVITEHLCTAIIDSTLEMHSTLSTEVDILKHSIESTQIDVTNSIDNAVFDGVREVKYSINTELESVSRNIKSVKNEINERIDTVLMDVERNIISRIDSKFECSEIKQEDEYAKECKGTYCGLEMTNKR